MPLPQLPPEVWDCIIDMIAEDWDDHKSLLSCCLTCHAWIHRTRYHFFKILYIDSTEQLSVIEAMLSSSPNFCDRVKRLTISNIGDGDLEDPIYVKSLNHSWVSLVASRLGPRLRNLAEITYEFIDLARVHTSFYQFNTMFSSTVKKLYLIYPQWTQYSQIVRLASAVRCVKFFLVDGYQNEDGILLAAHPLMSTVLVPHGPTLRHLTLRCSLSILGYVPWSAFRYPMSKVGVATSFPSMGSPDWLSLSQLFLSLHSLFQKLRLSQVGGSEVWVSLASEGREIHILMDALPQTPGQGPCRCLGIDIRPEPGGYAYFGQASALLGCLESGQFEMVRVSVDPFADEGPESPKTLTKNLSELITYWKFIDDALIFTPPFANLDRMEATFLGCEALFSCRFPCVLHPARKFLPELVARDPSAFCNADWPCVYHKGGSDKVDAPRFRHLRRLASTESLTTPDQTDTGGSNLLLQVGEDLVVA